MTAPGEPLPATYGEHLMSVDIQASGTRFPSLAPHRCTSASQTVVIAVLVR